MLIFLKKINFNNLKNSNGQSILEFAIILPFIFFFIFLHIQLCISYVLMKYANYISFMSARVVLTNGHLQNKEIGVVNNYLPGMLRNILRIDEPRVKNYDPLQGNFENATKVINEGPQWSDIKTKDNQNRNLGVEITYKIPVFLPFIRELSEKLDFKVTTFLGREPYHGGNNLVPWYVNDPDYGDSFGMNSACRSIYNDNGC